VGELAAMKINPGHTGRWVCAVTDSGKEELVTTPRQPFDRQDKAETIPDLPLRADA